MDWRNLRKNPFKFIIYYRMLHMIVKTNCGNTAEVEKLLRRGRCKQAKKHNKNLIYG